MALRSEERLYHRLRQEWSDSVGLCGVTDLLMRAAAQRSGCAALVAQDRSLSYRELFYYVLVMARQLRERGVVPGDRVALLISNSCEFYIAYFATWFCGAVVVPLNVYLHEREIAGILTDAQPRLVLTEQIFVQRVCLAAVATLVVDAVVWRESLSDAALATASVSVFPSTIRGNATAVILYTSGTTGTPKGVELSSDNVMSNALQVRARLFMVVGSEQGHRFFGVLPLFHAFSQNVLVWLSMMIGATVVLVPAIERKAIREGLAHKPTIFFGFPALYGLLVAMRDVDLTSVRLFVSGADAMPDKIRMAFSLLYGRKICSGYGLTEASPVIAVDGYGSDHPTNVVGAPLCDVVCQVRDAQGRVCERGHEGTLWVSGPNIMKGYYRAPEATQVVLQSGWLNTGDLALHDSHGLLTIVGRSKDLIINKGFNIYPQEVENVLLRHPAIFKAAVVGREESVGGQVPIAFVAVREGMMLGEEEVLLFCKQNLAAYKVPRVITCLSDLPMTATGKIDKKQLS